MEEHAPEDRTGSELERHVQAEHWRGAIPLKLEIHADEVTTVPGPSPFFVLAPRLGYLPQIADKALEHFKNVLPPGEDIPWFEYKGVALKWHIPTGVLYNLLAEGEYPWTLTVHFRLFPSKLLLSFHADALHANFFNSTKEAVYVLTGNSSPIMAMTKKNQEELWKNISNCDHESFYSNIEKLDITKPLKGKIPVRLYLRKKDFDTFTGWDSIEYTSKSLILGKEANQQKISDVIRQMLPHVPEDQIKNLSITVAGVEIDPGFDIISIYEQLRNPDLWLYISTVLKHPC